MATKGCIAGCNCPAGTVYDDFVKSCVPESQCSCYDVITHKNYAPGASVKRACNNCTCGNGRWKCTTFSCDENVCPGNQKLLDNVSPCRLTCENYDRLDQAKCPSPSFKGCGCPNGTVLQVYLQVLLLGIRSDITMKFL